LALRRRLANRCPQDRRGEIQRSVAALIEPRNKRARNRAQLHQVWARNARGEPMKPATNISRSVRIAPSPVPCSHPLPVPCLPSHRSAAASCYERRAV
jgi:hypothetical protein